MDDGSIITTVKVVLGLMGAGSAVLLGWLAAVLYRSLTGRV